MTVMVLHFLLVLCGGVLAFALVGASVVYSAWRMSRRHNGWER